MDTEKAIFISSIVLPLLTLSGVILWALITRRRNIETKHELLKEKKYSQEKDASNKLWQQLNTVKDRHISVLRDKIKRVRD